MIAGRTRVQLQGLILDAVENRRLLTVKFLTERKKSLIEAESGGLLEFVQTKFDLSMVAGTKRRDICGRVGTGKTILTTWLAGEARGVCFQIGVL